MRVFEDFGLGTYADRIGATMNEGLLMGGEFEIESIYRWDAQVENYFKVDTDGSLRNEGREFISVPLFRQDLVNAFNFLHDKLTFHLTWSPFSERTSIHIHVNCLNLESEHVRQAVLLYALFEDFFFDMTHPSRKNNIHCVPIGQTFLPVHYGSSLRTMVSRWHKYTALNILPLKQYGTIEFRHMHGHSDVELFNEWTALLARLIELGKQAPITKESLSSFASIEQWFGILFTGTRVGTYADFRNLRNITKNSLLDLKLIGV